MGFGTDIMSKLQELTGSIGSDGSILPGKESTVNYLVSFIKAQGDVDISVVDVENPETGEIEKKIKMAEYVNPDTGEIVPETVYNSYTEVYDGITAAGEFKTSSEYFGDGDVYIGVLSTAGSGEKLARALTFASGANLRYIPPDAGSPLTHVLSSRFFSIYITESSDGVTPVTIKLTCPTVKVSGTEYEDPISAFDEAYQIAQNLPFIKYYIRRGSSGDCYLKGFYANDDTAPSESDFADVTMNAFNDYNPITGDLSMSGTGGGFALVAMEDKVSSDSTDWSVSYSENQNYAFVLWRINGTPFHIGYAGEVSKWNIDYASQCWRRIITNSDEQITALAPIFNQGSGQAASKYSFWSMIIPQDGAYLLSVGNGGTYFYDHGFALRND